MKNLVLLSLVFVSTLSYGQRWQRASNGGGISGKDAACVWWDNQNEQVIKGGEAKGKIPVGARINICQMGSKNSFSAGPLVFINPTDKALRIKMEFAHTKDNGSECDIRGPIYSPGWVRVPAKSSKTADVTATGAYTEKFPPNYCILVKSAPVR